MSTGEAIFWGTVGFFALLAVLVFLRLLLRKGPPHWSQLKIGFFIERAPNFDEEEIEFKPPVPDSEKDTLVLPPRGE